MTCPHLLLLRRQALPVSQRLSAVVAVIAIVVIAVIVIRCAIAVAVVVRRTVTVAIFVDVVVCCAITVVAIVVRRAVTLVVHAIVHRTATEKEAKASSLVVFLITKVTFLCGGASGTPILAT